MKRIYIEILNTCNLSCAFCAKNTRTPKMMSPDEFEMIVRQAKAYTDYIYLHVQGEPLMHPLFDEFLSITDRLDMHVQLVTNGTYLHNHMDMAEHKSLRKVSFSLQSIEYQNVDIEDYMNTILTFSSKASVQNRPYVEIRFWRKDQMDLPKTAQCFSILKERFDFEETSRNGSYRLMNHVYLAFDNSFDWPDQNETSEDNTGYCHGALDQIAILSDGTVVPCCLDYNGMIRFGNIFDSSLSDILSSERYLNMKNGLQKHILTEDLCRKCTFRKRFD